MMEAKKVYLKTETKPFKEFIKALSLGNETTIPFILEPIGDIGESKEILKVKLTSVYKLINSKITGYYPNLELVKGKEDLETIFENNVLVITSSKKFIKFIEALETNKDKHIYIVILDLNDGYKKIYLTNESKKAFYYMLLGEQEEFDGKPINPDIVYTTENIFYKNILTEDDIKSLLKAIKTIETDEIRIVFSPNNSNSLDVYLQIGEKLNMEYAKWNFDKTKTDLENEITEETIKELIENGENEFFIQEFDEDEEKDIYYLKINKEDFENLLKGISELSEDVNFIILRNGAIILDGVDNQNNRIIAGITPEV